MQLAPSGKMPECRPRLRHASFSSKTLLHKFNSLIMNYLTSPLPERTGEPISLLHYLFLLCPEGSIQGSVLDGLGDVLRLDCFSSFQIGDCPGYFQDAIVRARSQALLGHGAFE